MERLLYLVCQMAEPKQGFTFCKLTRYDCAILHPHSGRDMMSWVQHCTIRVCYKAARTTDSWSTMVQRLGTPYCSKAVKDAPSPVTEILSGLEDQQNYQLKLSSS